MNKELAQKLKDSGFPQHLNFKEVCDDIYVCCLHQYRIDNEGDTKNDPYIPTLEELISALKPWMGNFALTWKPNLKTWRANIYRNGAIIGEGITPDEAVANLLLALNRNPTGE